MVRNKCLVKNVYLVVNERIRPKHSFNWNILTKKINKIHNCIYYKSWPLHQLYDMNYGFVLLSGIRLY